MTGVVVSLHSKEGPVVMEQIEAQVLVFKGVHTTEWVLEQGA